MSFSDETYAIFFVFIASCVHFAIDIAKELLVLYENVYEIYGDIRGASNCFKYEFYTQGKQKID